MQDDGGNLSNQILCQHEDERWIIDYNLKP